MKKNEMSAHIDLILRILEGHGSGAEKGELERWISESPDNRKLFEEIRSNWNSRPGHTPGTLEAYKTIADRLGFPTEKKPVLFARRRFIRAAAVFAGFLAIGFILYRPFFNASGTTYRTGYAEVSVFLLPDSSQVTLNANSSLTLGENWLAQVNRKVSLQGEAFFEVKRKQNGSPGKRSFKKFIVSTDNLEIEVLGTAFNVNSRDRETKVTLNSGQIRLKLLRGDREILMQPGDFVSVEPAGLPVIRKGIDADNYSNWKNGQLYFDGSTVNEIKALLQYNYKLEIVFQDPQKVKDVRLRGTFPSDELELLLQAIADVTHTEKVEQGDRIYYQEKEKQE